MTTVALSLQSTLYFSIMLPDQKKLHLHGTFTLCQKSDILLDIQVA